MIVSVKERCGLFPSQAPIEYETNMNNGMSTYSLKI